MNPGFFRRGGGTKGGVRQKFYYVDYYVDWEIRSQQLPKFSSAINKVDLSITRKSNDCYFSIISIFMSRDLFTLFHNSSVIYSLHIFTGRNEVVAKVMFLHVSVILFTGGVSRQGEPPGQGDPPAGRNPPGPGRPPWTGRTPPQQGGTPRTRHTPLDQGEHPPDQADPPGKQTPEYGLRAAGTHPTGMHSCLSKDYFSVQSYCNIHAVKVQKFYNALSYNKYLISELANCNLDILSKRCK